MLRLPQYLLTPGFLFEAFAMLKTGFWSAEVKKMGQISMGTLQEIQTNIFSNIYSATFLCILFETTRLRNTPSFITLILIINYITKYSLIRINKTDEAFPVYISKTKMSIVQERTV